MNEEAQQELKRILAKEPHELTANDIAFLKARYAYVGKNSRAKFAEVLSTPQEKPQKEKKVETPPVNNQSQTKDEKKNDPAKFPPDDGEDEDVLDPTTGKAIDSLDEDDEE